MPLSLGVELEGIAVRRNASLEPLPLQTQEQMRLIRDALDEAGLQSSVYIPLGDAESGPDYSVWNITIDATISEMTSESSADSVVAFRSRFGFEVVSPVFHDTPGSEWCSTLTAGIEAIGNAVKWKANRSTGFHVHIGPGAPNATFSLEEVKKIAIFCCRFEDAMDQYHPEHRRQDNDNILSNRHNALLAALSLPNIYDMIIAAETIRDVIKLVNYTENEQAYDGHSDSRFFKVNFTSLAKHNTIEFRQHEGTTEAYRITQWARTLLKMVAIARSTSYAQLRTPGETLEDLLPYICHGN